MKTYNMNPTRLFGIAALVMAAGFSVPALAQQCTTRTVYFAGDDHSQSSSNGWLGCHFVNISAITQEVTLTGLKGPNNEVTIVNQQSIAPGGSYKYSWYGNQNASSPGYRVSVTASPQTGEPSGDGALIVRCSAGYNSGGWNFAEVTVNAGLPF